MVRQMRSACAMKALPFLASRQAAVAITQTLSHLDAVAERAKAAQRRERLVDGVGGQQAGRLHLAAEAGTAPSR